MRDSMRPYALTVAERDAALAELSSEQQGFLINRLVRSRRTLFANVLAERKGYHLPDAASPEEIEVLLEDWTYSGFIDAGRVSVDLRCECGRPLRYQHQVQHKSSGEIRKFGIEHLKEHLAIDAEAVSAIQKGFQAIDYEQDEILIKQGLGWQPDPDLLSLYPLPPDVQEQLDLRLPLLERQMVRLRAQLQRTRRPSLRKPQSQPTPLPAWEQPIVQPSLFETVEYEQRPELEQDDIGPVLLHLPGSLADAAVQHLLRGVRSARVLCELLIKDHGGASNRYRTGKPTLYYSVCRFVESLPGAELLESRVEDRLYTYEKNR
ncbi:hypothetical protein [Gorillibacterium sp. sgz500922]|uniref:hypothetical protein n=1 Tax=Gorillibacterium sp. sgz500922 TaxID=3446694 RepID=UPI003F67C1D7